jgi:molybdopterin converting factor small subunit
MSPKTLPTAPSTLESPEILASLSPDILLANLRTAVERATTDADRTKFWALVAKLEAELARRSDTTVEGAKGAVADLKSIMNADDHSLAKRATDLATQAGDKIAPLAGATVSEKSSDAAGKATRSR